MLVQRFSRNMIGKDYVIGDIHGSYELLMQELDKIKFDFANDRLFCVGDLVDRGPNNATVVYLLDENWFFSVMGNHDAMAVDYHNLLHTDVLKITQEYINWYKANGGGWFIKQSDIIRSLIVSRLEKLPIAIEVETASGVTGIVHADCPFDHWIEFIRQLEDTSPQSTHLRKLVEVSLWNRSRIRERNSTVISGIDKVYHGHTVIPEAMTLGNRRYIDTGAVFTGKFTIEALD